MSHSKLPSNLPKRPPQLHSIEVQPGGSRPSIRWDLNDYSKFITRSPGLYHIQLETFHTAFTNWMLKERPQCVAGSKRIVLRSGMKIINLFKH